MKKNHSMEKNIGLKVKVFSNLIWKFGERITAQGITLIVSIILARLLSPKDYGAVALVMIFITIADVFVSNGFGNALIQKADADNLDFSSVFYMNIFISLILYALIFLGAPLIASFFELPVMCPALRVLGVRVIVAAINSVQQAYVARNMLFKHFFYATLFGTLFSGVAGICMAYYGFGIWALIAQYLTNTCIDTLILWFSVKWRPEWKYSWERGIILFSYGWKILIASLLNVAYGLIQNLTIGKVYTTEDLAFYNQGEKYPYVFAININDSISSVLFPALAQNQQNIDTVKQMTRKAIQVSTFIIWPLMVGLGVIAQPLVSLILTEKWLPCVLYLRIFCFVYGLWPIHTANLQAMNALGRSDLFLKLQYIKMGVTTIILLISVNYGPLAIAQGSIIAGVLGIFINATPNIKLLNYSYREQLSDLLKPLLLSLVMAVFIYPISLLSLSDFKITILQILFGGGFYILISILTKQETFYYLLFTIKGLKGNQ